MKIINFCEEKQKLEKRRRIKTECITTLDECKRAVDKNDSHYCFLKLLDIFIEDYDPSIYWRFDIFLNEINKNG